MEKSVVMSMKTVVTDIDGTLVYNGRLSDETIMVLKAFQKDNRLVLATGRNQQSIKWICEALEMEQMKTGALILVNGEQLYDYQDGSLTKMPCLSATDAKYIIKHARLAMMNVTVVTKEGRYSVTTCFQFVYMLLRRIFRRQPMKMYPKLKTMPDEIEKIEISGVYGFELFYWLLKPFLKQYEAVLVNRRWVEVLPKGTNKLQQVKYLMAKYEIALDDLYVFGDGGNDIAMLAYAKHSYCPKNGLPQAKKAAKNICPSCHEDGVAQVVAKLIEKDKGKSGKI